MTALARSQLAPPFPAQPILPSPFVGRITAVTCPTWRKRPLCRQERRLEITLSPSSGTVA